MFSLLHRKPLLITDFALQEATAEFHTFMDYYNRFNLPGIVVPQTAYMSPTPPRAHPPFRFFTNNNIPGVHLRSALTPHFGGLANASQAVAFPENEGTNSISIHLHVSIDDLRL